MRETPTRCMTGTEKPFYQVEGEPVSGKTLEEALAQVKSAIPRVLKLYPEKRGTQVWIYECRPVTVVTLEEVNSNSA